MTFFSEGGTLYAFFLDSEYDAKIALDCKSKKLAMELARTMLVSIERPIYKFKWSCDDHEEYWCSDDLERLGGRT